MSYNYAHIDQSSILIFLKEERNIEQKSSTLIKLGCTYNLLKLVSYERVLLIIFII